MVCALYCMQELVSLFSFYMLLRYIFKEVPRPGKWRIPLFSGVSLICSCAGFLLLTPGNEYAYEILDFAATAVALASIPFFFRKPRFWRGFAVLFLYYATVDTLWSFLATFFDAGIIGESIFRLIVTGAVCIAVYKSANRRDLNVMAGAFHEIPVWLLISLFLFELTNYYKEFGVSEAWYNFLYVVSSCLVFLSILYLAFRVFRLVYAQNDILRRLNEQLLYEDERERSDESLRRFRHDFKNHAIVIGAMLEQGDVSGARRYFAELSGEVAAASGRFSTGSPVVNALLDVKASEVAADGTRICFEGVIPASGIAPKDLCVCVGNLLDNAAEACRMLPDTVKKAITVKALTRHNLLLLSVENPVPPGRRSFGKGLPETTKRDKRRHGYGLRNVEDAVKKYNGTLQTSIENGVFTAEVLLEISDNKREEEIQ